MLQNLCAFSPDYPALLRELKDPLKPRASGHIVQFPSMLPAARKDKTEREQGRKL